MNYPALLIGIVMTQTGMCAAMVSQQVAYRQPFFRALGEIESGGKDYALGAKGEKSRYQISKEAWEESCNFPFVYEYVSNKYHSTCVANSYYQILNNRYYSYQGNRLRQDTPRDNIIFYIMWNWGFNKFKNVNFDLNRVPASVRDSAFRFSNLVYKYQNIN